MGQRQCLNPGWSGWPCANLSPKWRRGSGSPRSRLVLQSITKTDGILPLREEILSHLADRATESRFPLTPQRIVHDVRQVMPEDGIVCLDNGMYKIWFARNYRTRVANDNGRRAAFRNVGVDSVSRPACAGGMRRRRVHDELARDGNSGPTWFELGGAHRAGQRLRHDPLEAGCRQVR